MTTRKPNEPLKPLNWEERNRLFLLEGKIASLQKMLRPLLFEWLELDERRSAFCPRCDGPLEGTVKYLHPDTLEKVCEDCFQKRNKSFGSPT